MGYVMTTDATAGPPKVETITEEAPSVVYNPAEMTQLRAEVADLETRLAAVEELTAAHRGGV